MHLPSRTYYPIVMSMILLTIVDLTPTGGANIDKLIEIYESYAGKRPSERTIYRIISKLNDGIDPEESAITYTRKSKKWRFRKGGYLYSYMAI